MRDAGQGVHAAAAFGEPAHERPTVTGRSDGERGRRCAAGEGQSIRSGCGGRADERLYRGVDSVGLKAATLEALRGSGSLHEMRLFSPSREFVWRR